MGLWYGACNIDDKWVVVQAYMRIVQFFYFYTKYQLLEHII